MLGVALVDIRVHRPAGLAGLWPALALLVVVARFGHVGKGAQRWIEFGGLQSAAVGADEDRAGAGAGRPGSTARPGSGSATRCSCCCRWRRSLAPVGLILKEPNLGTAVITAVGGRRGVLRRRRALVEVRCWCWRRCRWWRGSPMRICTTTSARGSRPSCIPSRIRWAPATTSSSRRSRSAQAGMWGQGVPARHAGAPGFPAGEADRLHLHHDGRGVRLGGSAGGAGAAGADHRRRDADRAALPASVRAAGGVRHRR